MIEITPEIAIAEDELEFRFTHSSGPGGQNVNKVATAVQLRFDVQNATSLPIDVKSRLKKIAGRRITSEGILLIDARRYRTQEKNRQDAFQRFKYLIERASVKPKERRRRGPTAASKELRLKRKRQTGEKKKLRKSVDSSDIE